MTRRLAGDSAWRRSERTTLRLPGRIRMAIEAHLRSAFPYEGVGLLAVDRHVRDASSAAPVTAVHFFEGTNIEASATRFTMDPEEVIGALRTLRERGWLLGGIVHSHLSGPATPSAVDLNEAHYPDAMMIVVSFAASPVEMRAWRIEGDREVREVEIVPA